MLLGRKMRNRIIFLAIIALLFLYWRGVKTVAAEKGWDCTYHIVYATCNAKNNKAKLPGLWDVLKAGARF